MTTLIRSRAGAARCLIRTGRAFSRGAAAGAVLGRFAAGSLSIGVVSPETASTILDTPAFRNGAAFDGCAGERLRDTPFGVDSTARTVPPAAASGAREGDRRTARQEHHSLHRQHPHRGPGDVLRQLEAAGMTQAMETRATRTTVVRSGTYPWRSSVVRSTTLTGAPITHPPMGSDAGHRRPTPALQGPEGECGPRITRSADRLQRSRTHPLGLDSLVKSRPRGPSSTTRPYVDRIQLRSLVKKGSRQRGRHRDGSRAAQRRPYALLRCASPRRSSRPRASTKALEAFAETAPVTRASGKHLPVMARRVKNRRLASAGYVWAFASLTASPGARARARARYDRRRADGDRHTAAQRNLFNRVLGWLHHCLARRTFDDEGAAFPPPGTSALRTLEAFSPPGKIPHEGRRGDGKITLPEQIQSAACPCPCHAVAAATHQRHTSQTAAPGRSTASHVLSAT